MSDIRFPGTLHLHTEYSNIRIRDCIIKIEDAMTTAEELGHSVIGFTDHDCLSQAVKIEKIAKKHPNLKVIRGNEIYLCRNGLNSNNFIRGQDKYYHFILLAKDLVGFYQLCEISTRAWERSYMSYGIRRVPTYYQDLIDIVGSNPGHLIASTACLGGALPTQLLKYKDSGDIYLYNKIINWCQQMNRLFGQDNFYLELQPSLNKEQIYVNNELIKISKELNIPFIITNDSHYLRPEDRKIHKAFLNAQKGEREVDDFYATTYMMTDDEVKSLMKISKEDIEEAYKNIEKIKNICEDYTIQKPLKIPTLPWIEHPIKSSVADWYDKIPHFKVFNSSERESDKELVKAIIYGIEKNESLQNKATYNEIELCLQDVWISSTINNADWSAYFLNLQKIIEECWNAGSIVGCGRGSGVGFLLLYVLDITQINPLRETTKTYRFRFLNPNRVSVLDVDFDISGVNRHKVLNHLREVYGDDRVANVATFKTEASRSAILTSCRGLGIDNDIGNYLASFMKADRGIQRTLHQMFYGDEENGWAPNKNFVMEMTENYPEVWEVAQKIEGLINGSGLHAGGIVFVDEPFTNSTALMRAPDGTLCTQFELHDLEDCSLIKYDALSVEAMDKIQTCIELLCEYGYIERKPTLKETYEEAVGIYNLERDAKEMWDMVYNHQILSLFQFEKQSGVSGIALSKPESVDDLATLNSVIRLMAQEEGAEMPLNKFARFKRDMAQWDDEMISWGLDSEARQLLHKQFDISYGICESQEGFMQLVMLPACGGFDLTWSDRLRKSIAKKNPKDYDLLTKEYYENMKEKGLDEALCKYVWQVLVAYSRGYGFNKSHTLAYSLIALQEMNLAYRFPIVFWNTACLITDSGGAEYENEDEEEDLTEQIVEYYNEMEEFTEDDDEDNIEDSYDEDEDCDGFPVEVFKMKDGKKKKKVKSTNYGKVASAIGRMKAEGIQVELPDINKSTYTFSPDADNDLIRYGLSGITRVGKDLIGTIMDNRPYASWQDFTNKVKVNKLQMVSLIKSGAFDSLSDRQTTMKEYIYSVSDTKKVLNMRNLGMLIRNNLIPQDTYDYNIRVFNFNTYLRAKKNKLPNDFFGLDNVAFAFYEKNFDLDKLMPADTESGFKISKGIWDKIYHDNVFVLKGYIQKNHDRLLEELNNILISENWNKYALGNLSKWEMDSVSCYYHPHELKGIKYPLDDYSKLSEEPDIDRYIPIKGRMVPLFNIHRIAGTILDKNKDKNSLTILTTSGVVEVKIYGDAFAKYDKRLSEKLSTGKKKVIENSWLSRGNKIIVTGIRRGTNEFVAKKYSKTPYHLVELITKINEDGTIETKQERESC